MSPAPSGTGDLPSTRPDGAPPRRDKRFALCFAVTSFLAVGSGCLAAASAGVGAGVWGRNVAAWGMGAGLAWFVTRLRPAALFRALLLFTPLALLASLFQPGILGIHRWITFGPLPWNVALLLLPAATVAIAATARSGSPLTWWATLAMEAELCLQPDASQATAFAAAMIATLALTPSRSRTRVTASVFFVLAATWAWARPDPLPPVPEVEGILALARAVSWSLAALCALSLAAVAASPLPVLSKAGPDARPPVLALCVYLLGCLVTPWFGAFPVPLVGMGMSPIVGFWLAAGALLAGTRARLCPWTPTTPW